MTLPKLPLKKTEKLSIKEAYGKKLGELKAILHFKKTKAGMELSLREHLGKMIDRLDPAETIAIFGLTIIIKRLIDTVEPIKAAVTKIGLQPLYFPWIINPFQLWNQIFSGQTFTPPTSEQVEGQFPDWFDWIIAFTLAYIIIKHGGQLLGLMREGTSSLSGILLALLQ